MQQLISWIAKKAASWIVTGIFLMVTILGVVYALDFPNGAPDATQTPGGKFAANFTKIFNQLTFSSEKVTVSPDICTQWGLCLSTAAQKTDTSGAPVLYNLSNGGNWSNFTDQVLIDQWKGYYVKGCEVIGAQLGWDAAYVNGCKVGSDGDIDAVIGYSYQPAILRALNYLTAGGAPKEWVPPGCLSAPNIVRCVQGYSCGYQTYHPEWPWFISISCIGTPTP